MYPELLLLAAGRGRELELIALLQGWPNGQMNSCESKQLSKQSKEHLEKQLRMFFKSFNKTRRAALFLGVLEVHRLLGNQTIS